MPSGKPHKPFQVNSLQTFGLRGARTEDIPSAGLDRKNGIFLPTISLKLVTLMKQIQSNRPFKNRPRPAFLLPQRALQGDMTQGRPSFKPSFKRELQATVAEFTIGRPVPGASHLRLTLRRWTESHDLADGRFEGQLNRADGRPVDFDGHGTAKQGYRQYNPVRSLESG